MTQLSQATTNRAFLSINADLFNNPLYRDLNSDAKMLYSFYAQRQQVSVFHSQNGNSSFIDENGAFIYFSNEDAAKILNISVRKVSTLRSQLSDVGLIDVVRAGLSSFKIYVHEPLTTPQNVDLVLPWSNFSFKKTILHSDIKETLATTDMQNIPVDTQKLPLNQTQINQTNINTSETSKTQNHALKEQPTSKTVLHSDTDLSCLEALKNRLKQSLGIKNTLRLVTLANNQYDKAKNLSDIIFKAKSQVQALLLKSENWMYNQFAMKSLTFETNNHLKNGLESSLLRLTEIIYKSETKIKNQANLEYVFIRNFIKSAVMKYLDENVEMSNQQRQNLAETLNLKPSLSIM